MITTLGRTEASRIHRGNSREGMPIDFWDGKRKMLRERWSS